jgi:hypothetical protein
MATPHEFVAASVEELPEAKEDVESFEGLPYVQIGCLMSPRLQSAWRDIITYNEQLLGRPWPQGKVKPWLTKSKRRSQPTAAPRKTRKRARRGRG